MSGDADKVKIVPGDMPCLHCIVTAAIFAGGYADRGNWDGITQALMRCVAELVAAAPPDVQKKLIDLALDQFKSELVDAVTTRVGVPPVNVVERDGHFWSVDGPMRRQSANPASSTKH